MGSNNTGWAQYGGKKHRPFILDVSENSYSGPINRGKEGRREGEDEEEWHWLPWHCNSTNLASTEESAAITRRAGPVEPAGWALTH